MRDKLMLLVVLVGLIFGLSASALEYSPDCAEFSNKTTDWNRTLSVDKFDPSLGVLKGVKVSADACASQLFMLDSEDSEPQCWTVVTNAWLSAAMPDGKDFVLSLPEKTNQFCLSADLDEEPDFKGDDSFSFFIKECVKDERTYNDLENWIGPGKVEFRVIAKGITDVAGSSSFDQRVRTFANETICVTYYYESCDDGLWCNGIETSNGLICLPGTPPDCSDGIECTIDFCNEETDRCEHRADDSKCDDGLWCNGAETCDPAKGCQPGTPPDCNDGIECTIDFCNEETDRCEHRPDDSKCDDGIFCNGAETCDPVEGCLPGTPPDCNDNIECTIDFCNEETDRCEHRPDDSKCDDGIFCNGAETCDPVEGCLLGTPPDCNDNIECTIDFCNEETDECEHSPDDSKCDDGLWCNGAETCDPVEGCLLGTPPDCNDNIECTIDSCNEETDKCEHRPDDDFCDDGIFCNGAETCDPVEGCLLGTPPDCNDDIDCTIDFCNEETDKCEHSPDDGFCDDYDVCNGIEVCDPASGCLPGTPLDCDDKDPCTIDSCDPIEGCIHTAIDCDDGDPCTIDECIDGICVHTQIPGCGCDCSAYAPDICLPMVCIERGGVLVCKDYSLPQYLPQVKNKVMSAGGGCTGDCKSFNLVLPSSINWNTPGPYEYSVVCEDASKTCSSTDTGRLVLDYNCGCGACGCSGFC
ncbi:choice-of-anchor E domain-containing protein [Methanothrix sp.]|uniref:choice-of-anchor E domain-containing protein n=1 Tax=Methanothrix sp. TaxID=90426 RepID=UPI001BD2A5B4